MPQPGDWSTMEVSAQDGGREKAPPQSPRVALFRDGQMDKKGPADPGPLWAPRGRGGPQLDQMKPI